MGRLFAPAYITSGHRRPCRPTESCMYVTAPSTPPMEHLLMSDLLCSLIGSSRSTASSARQSQCRRGWPMFCSRGSLQAIRRPWVHALDLSGFEPSDINVKVEDGKIIVHARREEKDGTDFSLSEIRRSVSIPDGVDKAKVNCFLADDGKFIIKGNYTPVRKPESCGGKNVSTDCPCSTTSKMTADETTGHRDEKLVKTPTEQTTELESNSTSSGDIKEEQKPLVEQEEVEQVDVADGSVANGEHQLGADVDTLDVDADKLDADKLQYTDAGELGADADKLGADADKLGADVDKLDTDVDILGADVSVDVTVTEAADRSTAGSPVPSDDFTVLDPPEEDTDNEAIEEVKITEVEALAPLMDETQVVETADGKRQFQIRINLKNFKPDDVSVRSQDNSLLIDARKEWNHEGVYTSQELHRSYPLPPEAEKGSDATAKMNETGLLFVSMPMNTSGINADIPVEKESE